MVITPGIYNAQVIDAEWLPNRKQNGHYVKITFKLLTQDQFKGYKISSFFNFDNPNSNAEKIALKKWTLFCTASLMNQMVFNWKTGPADNQLASLIGKIMDIQIGTYPGNNGYENNSCEDWFPMSAPSASQTIEECPPKAPKPPKVEHPNFDDLNDEIPF